MVVKKIVSKKLNNTLILCWPFHTANVYFTFNQVYSSVALRFIKILWLGDRQWRMQIFLFHLGFTKMKL